jgi:hypothetical protein
MDSCRGARQGARVANSPIPVALSDIICNNLSGGLPAAPAVEAARVHDHENDDQSGFSISDKRCVPFHRKTPLTKAVVVDVLAEVDIDGIFSLVI